MSGSDSIVIAGAAQAGGRAAQAMRGAGFEGRILLIGEETWLPYERPPLSKALIVEGGGHETVHLHDPDYYESHRIETLLGAPVESIDLAARTVRVDGGDIAYDRLLLTTGARVRRLPVPGADLPGVHYLRTLDDSFAIRDSLVPGARVAVVGGGFIGLEIAASARKRGCAVTVIEATDRLMGRAVAPEIGNWFAEMHRAKGVDIRLGAGVERFGGEGKLEHVALVGGEEIPCDLAIVGIGIIPNSEIALEAGLEVENGIVVDAFGRTGDPHIWAAGDVANQPNALLGRNLRLESYENAQTQGTAVGGNMVSDEAKAHEDRLWVWSDQFDVNLQMIGLADDYDRIVHRGEPTEESFAVFYLASGKVVAANTINLGREMRTIERVVAARAELSPEQLADPSVNLRKLMRA
ncbi:MAG: FAD-dependent oxidoreductase [Rhodospirillaceae bacterium]|jgi:3-phenylpropionate/trans-cinnamate dioxygenase ferredoxin reductase component|nr:FAD-dependent oxidoreductase [Rhodospirillaceae bacterium]